jgi:hypothetical protein
MPAKHRGMQLTMQPQQAEARIVAAHAGAAPA